MITGSVFGRQATISLSVFDASGREIEVEAVVDTGFTGYLSLPPNLIVALSMPFSHQMLSRLGDGSTRLLDVHNGTVLWDEEEVDVNMLAGGDEILVGTSLMDGFDLQIQFADGGLVTLERM